MWCACRGAVVHKMCVMCVWRACKSALAPMRCVVRVWRACKSSLAPLTSVMVCGVRVGVHPCIIYVYGPHIYTNVCHVRVACV